MIRFLSASPRAAAAARGITLGNMGFRRYRISLVTTLACVLLSACAASFQPKRFPTTALLYKASIGEFQKKHWENAVTGFERLTLDLSARDSLLPLSYLYLARAHEHLGDYLLAGQSFGRIAESFPDDTLADHALLWAGDAYMHLWKSPQLDATYGAIAQTQYRLLLNLYPSSVVRPSAEKALLRIDEQMAAKDYDTGMHYVRRRAFDSALIYLKDVVRNFPNTNHAHDAMLRMVEVYRRPEMGYKEEAAEMCTALRGAYLGDAEVLKMCGPMIASDSATAKLAPTGVRKPVTPPQR